MNNLFFILLVKYGNMRQKNATTFNHNHVVVLGKKSFIELEKFSNPRCILFSKLWNSFSKPWNLFSKVWKIFSMV